MPLHRFLAVLLLLSLALTGCNPGAAPTPPASATPEATATTPPSPTPRMTTEIQELRLLAGPQAGDWRVVGLVANRSSFAVRGVGLRVVLEGAAGTALAEQLVPLALTNLAPGEVSPFTARFAETWVSATSARAEVIGYRGARFTRTSISAGELQRVPSIEGGEVILGELTNSSGTPVDIDGMALLALDADGQPSGLAVPTVLLSHLEPGQSSPILALLEPGIEAVELSSFVDAVAAAAMAPVPLGFPEPPTVQLDAQGDPFVLGSIKNEGSTYRWASFILRVSLEGEVVAAVEVLPPVPLGPGETRPFSVTDLPGLAALLEGREWIPEDLAVEAVVDPRASSVYRAPTEVLGLELYSFEPIGGSLFLRGRVTNDQAAAVEGPVVLASIRTTEGRLVAAGWLVAAEALEAGASADFVLALTLPRGADLAMSEYDVLAVALPGQ